MSSAPIVQNRSRWRKLSSREMGVMVVLFVFACTLATRYSGVLQFLDFQAYDFLIRHQQRAPTSEPIVLVEMTESDIHSPSLDYPLTDRKLADLLRILAAGKPAAIGLDIWRDLPVPKDGAHLHEFEQVLLDHPNIIAIFSLTGIAPPPALQWDHDRVAFNDNFPPDVRVDHTIPKVRRSLLFADSQSGESFYSFPFRLAMLYLEGKEIMPEIDPRDEATLLWGKARLRPFQPNDGAYVRADAGGRQILLDFKCPDDFVHYTVMEALSGQIPPDKLRDKIVLVGINTPSVADERVTPIRRDHRGVRIQALTINQLLRHALNGEPPIRFWNDWLEDGWILLWCCAGGAIGYLARAVWRFVPAIVLSLLGLAGFTWAAFAIGWWIPITAPAIGLVCAAGMVVSFVSSQERQMRSILMKLYSRHVSREIAESIWENRESFLAGHRPLAQKLTVTVLFTDLKGFSTLAESMEAGRLYGWLNGYLGAMAEVIQIHGGVLKQFTGDGILALFGVPVPHTTRVQQADDASAAVKCALAMGRRLVELSHEWRQAGLPSVSMRAGIYTGEVAAGSVGSDDRFEYAVVGDVVNTAARLESYDKSLADPDQLPNRCRILIGAPTHELLDHAFQTREIGLLEVKGKATKVSVHQVIGETSAAAD
jgi:adenylate cyclase